MPKETSLDSRHSIKRRTDIRLSRPLRHHHHWVAERYGQHLKIVTLVIKDSTTKREEQYNRRNNGCRLSGHRETVQAYSSIVRIL